MAQLFSNNATTTIISGISETDTTILVNTGDGSLFPEVSDPNDFFVATLEDVAGNYEIVRCDQRVGDNFTVIRGYDNTAALPFVAGDRIELRITAAALGSFFQSDGNIDGGTYNPDTSGAEVLIRRSSNSGTVPAQLTTGELAIDVASGKLYYGDSGSGVSLLVQQIYILPESSTPVDPKNGALWLQTDTLLMLFYYDGTWSRISPIGEDGVLAPPLNVTDGAIQYIFADNTDLAEQLNLFDASMYFNSTGIGVQADFSVDVGNTTFFGGVVGIGGDLSIDGDAAVVGVDTTFTRSGHGPFLHHHPTNFSGGTVYSSQSEPPTDVQNYEPGDIWLEID